MKLLGLVAVLLGGCFAPVSQPPPAPPRQTKLDLDIQQAQLSNGLRVVLVRDPHAREVQVTMRYGVGSIDDPSGQEGVAHVVEHLMFQQKVGEQTLFAKLESATSSYNGETSHDTTTYSERGPSGSLEAMLAVEAVRLGYRCTSITDAVFQREREVVQNERRQKANAQALRNALEVATYPIDHPYQHPTSGDEASLAALTREQACAFADAYYTPGNAVMVISTSLAPEVVATSLQKFLAHIPARTTSAVKHAVPVVRGGTYFGKAPLESDSMLVTWPLPAEPSQRMRVRLVIKQVVAVASGFIGGNVYPLELGDDRSLQDGMLIVLGPKDTPESVTKSLKEMMAALPDVYRYSWLFDLGFSFGVIRQSQMAAMFHGYEDGFERDVRIAGEVLAGRDARTLMSAELDAVQQLYPSVSADIVEKEIPLERAAIVTLTPSADALAKPDELSAPEIHDLGQQRVAVDPDEANKPTHGRDVPVPGTVIQRTLANGMRVVLLPLTSVPTVDIRLVFDAGSAEDPPARRGASAVAAYGLSVDMHYLADFKAMVKAGGKLTPHLTLDSTTFSVSGLDMHMDYLLAGLRRWVREGYYKENAINIARVAVQKETDLDALGNAWDVARFGTGHPYVGAGDVRTMSSALTLDDAKEFRALHYTPDHATLVIAGKFDAKLADQWIDFLFADWSPSVRSPESPTVHVAPQPVSLAADEKSAQIKLRISIPTTSTDRAAHLVAAQMFAQIADDVRHQLGATYGLSVIFDDERLASSYVGVGGVVAPRAGEVLTFVRDHLDALRADPTVAAVAFVQARRRVLDRLAAVPVTSNELASGVEAEIAGARDLLGSQATARAVEKLTLASMPSALAELDLSRAAILMRGPAHDVNAAYAAIGRTPTRVAVTDDETPFTPPPAVKDVEDQRLREEDFEDAITSPRVQKGFSGSLLVGYGFGEVDQRGFTGYAVAAEAGVRLNLATIGLHLDLGQFSGTYELNNGRSGLDSHIKDTTIGLDAYLQGEAYDRLWGGVLLGVRWDHPTDTQQGGTFEDMPLSPAWKAGLDIGLELGVDVLELDGNRLAIYTRLDSQVISGNSLSAFTAGVGYHR